MKDLQTRFAERAARKAENEALTPPDGSGNDRVGNAVAIALDATAALAELTEEEQHEAYRRMSNGGEPTEGFTETDTSGWSRAGIGLINPFMADVTGRLPGGEQSGNGSGDGFGGPSAADVFANNGGNVAPAGGWGANQTGANGGQGEQTPPDETIGEDGKPLTIAKLKEVLDNRNPPVKYEGDANLARLQELVRESATPAPAAE